ncbi:MAG: TVP38/TMEM64 family protein [Provencibacterium sp.]|nr:TVP38/TMEM64 family protein [Provencibacterium sp.]
MKKTSLNRKTLLLGTASLLLLAVMTAATIWLWPWFSNLSTPEGQQQLQSFVSGLGFAGWLIMLGLQILQIVVAVIPGEPIEILMGMLYGAWGGFFTCELGVLAGSLLVFFAVRLIGPPLVQAVFGEEKLKSYAFLQNTGRLEFVTFLLFFIPGTPKDILTYVAGLTAISPLRFLSIASFARIPSIFSSTYAGSTLAKGDWRSGLIIFAAVGIISLAGILLHKKLMAKLHRKSPTNGTDGEQTGRTQDTAFYTRQEKTGR